MSLFINKTPKSKSFANSREEPESFRRIHQLAQVFRAKALAERQKSLTPRSSAPVGWLQKQSDQSCHSRAGSTQAAGQPPLVRKATASSLCSHADDTVKAIKACPRCLQSCGLVFVKAPSKTSVDPFGVLPTAMDAEKYTLVQHFMRPYLPIRSTFQWIDENARISMGMNCLSDNLHFYCLLAAITARMKYVTMELGSNSDLPERYALRANILMRRHLLCHGPLTQQIMTDMFLQASAESYCQNWPAARIHWTALKGSAAVLGGFAKLNPHVSMMFCRGDLFAAAVTNTQPILDLCWDPGPLDAQSDICIRVVSAEFMGASLREISADSFNHALLDIIEDVIGFANTMQSIWSGFSDLKLDRDWAWARASALTHRLLSIEVFAHTPGRRSDQQADIEELDVLVEDCTRVALVVWLNSVLSRLLAPSQQSQIATKSSMACCLMQERLMRMLNVAGFIEEDVPGVLPKHWMVMLWIIAVGLLMAVDEQEVIWVSSCFIAISAQVGIKTYGEFEGRISNGYLWLGLFEEARGRPLTKLYDNTRRQADYMVVVTK